MEISEISNRILVGLLQARTGQELSVSRQWRIASSLSGLFREHGIGSVDQLISMLTHSRESSLARKVVEAMLNNETYFFRDRQMFDLLRQRALPQIAQRRAGSRKLSMVGRMLHRPGGPVAGDDAGRPGGSVGRLVDRYSRY